MRDDDAHDASKFYGFRCHFDKDVNAWVFASPEERDRWQVQNYGSVRNSFRLPDEPDARPSLSYRHPFWTDDERRRYERAVAAAPAEQYRQLDVLVYLGELAKIASGLKTKPLQDMPGGRG